MRSGLGGFYLPFWKRGKKVKATPIKPGVSYFISGENMIFDLNGMNFTFEGFYVQFTDEGLFIIINDEVPMNLTFISQVAENDIDYKPAQAQDADSVQFTLQLKEDIYSELKEKISVATNIKDIFEIDHHGKQSLKKFSSYLLISWGSRSTIDG